MGVITVPQWGINSLPGSAQLGKYGVHTQQNTRKTKTAMNKSCVYFNLGITLKGWGEDWICSREMCTACQMSRAFQTQVPVLSLSDRSRRTERGLIHWWQVYLHLKSLADTSLVSSVAVRSDLGFSAFSLTLCSLLQPLLLGWLLYRGSSYELTPFSGCFSPPGLNLAVKRCGWTVMLVC